VIVEPLQLVIVHWDRPEHCLETVRCFQAQDVPLRITVVDNGSSAAVRERLTEQASGTSLLALPENVGFGPAANRGLERALKETSGEFLAVAPHDARPASGCLRRIVDELRRRPRAGMASAEYGFGLRQRYDWLRGVSLRPAPDHPPGWHDALYPHGTLMVFRRACLEEVGLFDERFFAYSEEHDLGLRARRAGWEVGVVGGAVVHNPIRAASSAISQYLQMRNSLLVVRKQSGVAASVVRTAVVLLNTVALLARRSRRMAGHSTKVRLKGVGDFWRGRFGPPPDELR
jgi:GT2 family glycosyltransferase